jgi:hypothetical protein
MVRKRCKLARNVVVLDAQSEEQKRISAELVPTLRECMEFIRENLAKAGHGDMAFCIVLEKPGMVMRIKTTLDYEQVEIRRIK